jgi:hypothetical protein
MKNAILLLIGTLLASSAIAQQPEIYGYNIQSCYLKDTLQVVAITKNCDSVVWSTSGSGYFVKKSTAPEDSINYYVLGLEDKDPDNVFKLILTGFGNGQKAEFEMSPRTLPIPKVKVDFVDSLFIYGDSVEIIFNNRSTIAHDGIDKYRYDFGDGSFKIVNGGQKVVSHFYKKSGSYSLRFCAMSSHGCISCINEGLLIMPAPTSINRLENKKIDCYKYADGVMQFYPNKVEKMELYDLNGRLLANSKSQGALPFHISKNQVFVLKVFIGENVFSQKIFTH